MLTRRALTELSRAHEEEVVLSVYIARDGSDPGARGAWRLRLDGALGGIRSEIERENADVAAFDRAVGEGRGVVALDGEMIDAPVVERARELLSDEKRSVLHAE